MENRVILHVDLDAFYASVEQLDNPELKGKPVMVGGTSTRGVVAACSYEARRYGVHSAMSGVMARKLCPKGVFLKGRMERYQAVSSAIFKILHEFTDQIQKVSIDEAYLDMTDSSEPPHEIAHRIKESVRKQIGLTLSVGISYNKFLAKLASDWHKPDGIFEIKSSQMPDILKPLSLIKVHGLGGKTAKKLNGIGLHTIGDLLECSEETLAFIIGSNRANELYHRIRGHDPRPVEVSTNRKSYGRETTFNSDTKDRDHIQEILRQFLFELTFKLVKTDQVARTVVIKIKYEDFEQITRSHSLTAHTNNLQLFEAAMVQLASQFPLQKKVRLVGIALSNIESNRQYQLSFFDS